MTSLADLTSEVYTITNHPELVAETLVAIRNATLKAHHRDFYFKDLYETGIMFGTSDYFQTMEPKAINPQYRSLKYLRKYDAVNLAPGLFLEVLTPDVLFDQYGANRTNVFYAAGAELNIRMNTQEQYMLMGMYVHPIVTSTGFSSWLADEFPAAITYAAAATVFKSLGMDSQQAVYSAMANEEYAMVDMSNIQTIGS